jgi:hypothetical protein
MNKLLRQQMKTRHNKLWVGMYVRKNNKAELSYRTKAEERDRLKLEREDEVWESEINTTRHTYGG